MLIRRLLTCATLLVILIVAIVIGVLIIHKNRGDIMLMSGEKAAVQVARKTYDKTGSVAYEARQVEGPEGTMINRILAPEYLFIVKAPKQGSNFEVHYAITLEKIFHIGWVAKKAEVLSLWNEQELADYLKRRKAESTETAPAAQ